MTRSNKHLSLLGAEYWEKNSIAKKVAKHVNHWKKIDMLTNLFNNKFLLLLTANAFRLSET